MDLMESLITEIPTPSSFWNYDKAGFFSFGSRVAVVWDVASAFASSLCFAGIFNRVPVQTADGIDLGAG